MKVVMEDGNGMVRSFDWNSVKALMDDDIREAVHAKLAPCTPQQFLDEYVVQHATKFGLPFEIN